MSKQFRGTGVALVTPFNEDKSINFSGLANLINHVTADGNGVDYVVSLGTTGESVTLSKEEKIEVLDFTVKEVAGRVPIAAGFGGNNTNEVIESIKGYHFTGVDAILSASPAYNKPSQEGIYQHFKAITAVAPKPVILYNVPGRTSSNMSAATTLRLAKDFDNVIAVKEASGDLAQCMQIVKNKPDGFSVLSGEDLLTTPMLSFGMDGVISVMANAFPVDFSNMVRSGLSGDFKTAQALLYKYNDIDSLLYKEGNPVGIKAALDVLGVCKQNLRLPLVKASDNLYNELKQNIKAL